MTGRTGSIVHKLHSRQLGSQQRRLYTQVLPGARYTIFASRTVPVRALNEMLYCKVPARLQFPIESVVDKDKRLLGKS